MGKLLVLFVFVFFSGVYFSQSDCVDYSVKKQPAVMNIKGIRFCGDKITIHEKRYDVLNFEDLGNSVEITFGYPEYGGRKMGAIAIEKGTGEVKAIIELYRVPDDPSTKTKGNLVLQKKETEQERAERVEIERINYQMLAVQAQSNDQKIKIEINSALEKKEYFKALQLFNDLNYEDNELLNKINTGWLPEKERYSKIYQNYTAEFNQVKKEYFTSEKEFYSKYKENIKSKEISINGHKAYSSLIETTKDLKLKSEIKAKLENANWFYSKQNNQHLFVPLCVDNNRINYYDTNSVNKYKLCVQYDTISKSYYPKIAFYKYDSLVNWSPIVNEYDFAVKSYIMSYPEKLNQLYEQVINNYGKQLLTENYPLLMISMDSIETISSNTLIKISNPGDGKKNIMYENYNEIFKIIDDKIEKYFSEDIKLYTYGNKIPVPASEFYNPALLYYAKKMYPNADSLVFVYGNKELNEMLGNKGSILLHNNNIYYYYYIVPITKGKLEIKPKPDKNNWVKGQEPYMLYFYDKNGNFNDLEVNIISESKIALSEIDIKKLVLDSSFYKPKMPIGYSHEACLIEQYPIQYTQYQIGYSDNARYYNKRNIAAADYYYNENLCFKKLPIYNSNLLYSEGDRKPLNVLVTPSLILFDLGLNKGSSYDPFPDQLKALKTWKILSSYFKYITKYLENKNEKDLIKADKYLAEYKEIFDQN